MNNNEIGRWTTKQPSQDGWYWMRGGDSYGYFEGCVLVDLKDKTCFFDGEWCDLNILPNTEWGEYPIPSPSSN